MDTAGNEENGMNLSGTGDEMNNSSVAVEGQDDQADEVERIDKFARSEIFVQRLYHVCYMAEAAQRVGYNGSAPTFVPLCKELSVDEEPEIRQALAEQLPQLARIFTTEGTEVALQDVAVLLQIANTLLTDECEEVQLAAEQAFSEMAHVVRTVGGAIESDMLGIVLKLACSKEEAQRVCAANLLTGFAEGLERGPFEERAVPRIIELAQDQEFRVRKAVAIGLPRCCKALSASPSSVDHLLLPVYVALSQDSVWAVRMACAEGIVRIAEVVSAEARARYLASTIERLARDASNWVRDSALQMLGPLLAMLRGTQELSHRLVALFTSMAEPFPGDNRLRLYCAFNFPAVVKSLGPERWPELQGAYRTLLCSDQAAVRKTLGYSLHELAQVLGEGVTKEHLLPAFQAFMADIDEVRVGVAKNLVPFITTLPKDSRLQCVQLLPTMVWVAGTPPAPKTPTPPPPPTAAFQVPRLGEAETPQPSVEGGETEGCGLEIDPEATAHPPQDLDQAVAESIGRISGGEGGEGGSGNGYGDGDGDGDGDVEVGREEGGAEEAPPVPSTSLSESDESEKAPGGRSEAGSVGDRSWRFRGRGEEGQEEGGGVWVDSNGRVRKPARVVRCKSFWHLRRLVVEQLEGIASLLELVEVNEILLPFALELCRDPIASVRAEAAKQAGLLVLQLEKLGEEAIMTAAIAKIRELAQSPSFKDRQMFVVTSSELIQGLTSPPLVEELLVPLLTMCKDSVVNVRVRVARALAEAGKLPDFLSRYPAVQTSLEALWEDRDRDVAFFAKQTLEGRENGRKGTVETPKELVPSTIRVEESKSREGEEVGNKRHSNCDKITREVQKLSVED